MLVFKCDLCKKEIKDRKKLIKVGINFPEFCLCSACGKPVLDFLKKNKLLEKTDIIIK